jgi:acyl-CoA thioesterase-1
MAHELESESTYLFIGDSVTDCGRRDDADRQLGSGYVRRLDEAFHAAGTAVSTINRGISGNRVSDLQNRWNDDCLILAPDLVSVLIGVNDMWRRYDSDDPTSAETFEAGYRDILTRLADSRAVTLVLMEPFLLPVRDEQRSWREDLDAKIAVVHRLANDFGATLVRTDEHLTAKSEELGAAAIAADGVHPTPLGHELLAKLWLDTVTAA